MENDYKIVAEAAKGLNYMSETDAPLELKEVAPGKSNVDTVLQLCGRPAGSIVEKVTIEHFFRNMVKADPAAPAADQQLATRFQQLQQILKEHLRNVEVYRIGTITIDAVIIGALPNGNLLTLKTKLVET
jgi:hypothetical protein